MAGAANEGDDRRRKPQEAKVFKLVRLEGPFYPQLAY